MKQMSILVLVGSLRAASVNRQLAELAVETAPDGVALTIYPSLDRLPFYDEDVENAGAPAAVTDLWAAVAAAEKLDLGAIDQYRIRSSAALRRALSPRQYLIARGVSPLKIMVNFASASDFVADNSTPEGRHQNQRGKRMGVPP